MRSTQETEKVNVSVFTKAWTLSVLAAFLLTGFAPEAVLAGSVGRRNTAIGLTAGTIYAASKGHGGAALALGAGSAYAWKRYGDSKHHRHYYRRHGHVYYKTYHSQHHGYRHG